jgi:hypothetical protein
MNTKTKLSLVAILASCFCMAIGSPGRGASSPSGYGLCCPARHYESPVLPGTRSADQTVTSPARQGVGQAE